jgi:hypothetical protein
MLSAEAEEIIRKLQNRAGRLEQGFVCVVALLILMLLAAWQSTKPQENLRVRELSIVDGNGTARLIFGAPVPNPVVDGKVHERRTQATGIIFNDSSGNERGGFGMLDDGSMNLCFDDQKVERNCLFFMPKFGNGVALNDVNGETRALLYLDPTGTPRLLLRDAKGQTLTSLPESAKETKPQ